MTSPMVSQLHIHVFARFETDALWPHGVWQAELSEQPYSTDECDYFIKKLREVLK